MSADCSIVTSFSLSSDGVAILRAALDVYHRESGKSKSLPDDFKRDVESVWKLFWSIQPDCSLYASVIKELPPKKEPDDGGA